MKQWAWQQLLLRRYTRKADAALVANDWEEAIFISLMAGYHQASISRTLS
jgi:hypothetical protein